jgi:radical SAM superfamily enzyme YgiQ (UPF0313 family)
VTGFFGDSIRFRSDDSVVEEMLRLKARAASEQGLMGVFFIDDNFAINVKRTKSLLREIIRRDAVLPWVAQISMNLLRDEELLDLIKESGGRWIFIGLESIDAASLKAVNKGFNKPADYRATLQKLADRGIYAITSFIFGMEGDTPGISDRTLESIESWPPGLPVFGLLTPYPATPLYDRLMQEGRLTRPKHWLDFRPFRMAFTPESISITQAEQEVNNAWERSYDEHAIAEALAKIESRPFKERMVMLCTRFAFRGIYFPMMSKAAWISVLFKNRRVIIQLIREALVEKNKPPKAPVPITPQEVTSKATAE